MTKPRGSNSFARPTGGDLRCSFCQKPQKDVRKLIAGPSVSICNECIHVCQDIIADDPRFSGAPPADGRLTATTPLMPAAAAAVICALCRMPTPLEDGVLIHNRGVLCPGCIGEVQIAVANRSSAK